MKDLDHEDFEKGEKGTNLGKAKLLARGLASKRLFHNERHYNTNFTRLTKENIEYKIFSLSNLICMSSAHSHSKKKLGGT